LREGGAVRIPVYVEAHVGGHTDDATQAWLFELEFATGRYETTRTDDPGPITKSGIGASRIVR
jgi:hypothetical protein